jgi:hypothetical protein
MTQQYGSRREEHARRAVRLAILVAAAALQDLLDWANYLSVEASCCQKAGI